MASSAEGNGAAICEARLADRDDTAAQGDNVEDVRRPELEKQYASIWNQYGSSLVRLASSYEDVAHAREDLVQEIQLALWKALPTFRGDCSMRTFVYRIAHNRALTHVWQSRTQAQSSDELIEVGDPRPGPESSAIKNADYSALLNAVLKLPIPYRQVITMALEELPQGEIATVLGITENNVAVRLNRARKLLREELGEKK
jgi:RNA polymerase sigma-70 factor (ECF subfamily)